MMLEETLRRQKILVQTRKDLTEAMEQTSDLWKGKTLGIQIPDEVRSRLDVQTAAWDLRTFKRTVATAILLGLKQMETLHKPLVVLKPPYDSATNIVEGSPDTELHNGESSMAEVH